MQQELATLRRETHAALCLACGKCSTMCPLSPSGWFSASRMVAIRDAGTEMSVLSEDGSANIRAQARALEACLTCGSCEVRCPEGVHFVDFVRGVRSLAACMGRRPCPHGEMLQTTARLMAVPDAPKRDLSWLGDDLEISEEGEIALFVGCLPFFDLLFERELGMQTLDIARAAIRLLNRLGIKPVVLQEERCCGHDQLWNGESETFQVLAQANAEAYEERGVKRILTTCGECCRTWRMDYPGAVPAYQPTVEHFAEFLAARIEEGDLVASRAGPQVTFQDPCRLGRHLGITEAPRQVLQALGSTTNGNFVEMEHAGADAQCCGTAGFIHCDASSRRLQSERLREAAATGARKLITACPKCLIHFNCAQTEDRRCKRESIDIEVEDLTILAAAMLDRAQPSAPAETQQPRGEA